ncbi:MAG: DUF721 domain-containing protein [Gaiellaceae bacterium]|jgi:hypothetical protein
MDKLEREIQAEARRAGLPAASELVRVWPEAVGETIAANAWPARFARGGVLVVNTSSATWAFELKHLAVEILTRLREALGEDCPRELRFSPGPVPARGKKRETTGPSAGPDIGACERSQAERLTATIENDELRELVARAAAASLAKSAGK